VLQANIGFEYRVIAVESAVCTPRFVYIETQGGCETDALGDSRIDLAVYDREIVCAEGL
jgi:hypothetical protein